MKAECYDALKRYANGYKIRMLATRIQKITLDVLQVHDCVGFYFSALEKGPLKRAGP